MNRNFVMVMVLVFLIFTVLGISYQAFGQEPTTSQFIVSRMVVAEGIEDREPVGVSETFPVSAERVYCFLEATNITDDTEVTFAWYLDGQEIHTFSLLLEEGSRWRTYAYKNLWGQTGDWMVELRDSEGNTIKSITFTVE